jgi:hypothetical protein
LALLLVALVGAVEAKIHALKAKLGTLDQLKKSLMHDFASGRCGKRHHHQQHTRFERRQFALPPNPNFDTKTIQPNRIQLMSTLTIRLPEDKHTRIRQLAKHREMSVNKLFEELATISIAEFDAESRAWRRVVRRKRALHSCPSSTQLFPT